MGNTFDLGAIIAHIKADTADFERGIGSAKGKLASFGGAMANLGQQSAVFAGVIGAGAVAAIGTSIKAYNEAETAQKQLEHAVLNVSKATRQQLTDTNRLADALEEKGVLDGDNIRTGLAQLSTFGLSNKAVQGLGGSLADLAVNQFGVNASGEQLTQTANMMAKALQGQFGVLEKSGIRFTEAQRAIIMTGTEMEKVKAINEGFAQNLKFTNDVARQTAEGSIARLGVQFGNLQEAMGEMLSYALVPLVEGLTSIMKNQDVVSFFYRIGSALSAIISMIGGADLSAELAEALGVELDSPVMQGILGFINVLKGLASWISNNQELVMTFLKGLGVAMATLMVIGTITALIMALSNPLVLVSLAIAALYTAWETNFLGMRDIMDSVFTFFQAIITSVVMPIIGMLTSRITDNWGEIRAITSGVWNIIVGLLRTAMGVILAIFAVATGLITGDWSKAKDGILAASQLVYSGVIQTFNGLVSYLTGVGSYILKRLTQPFEDAWRTIEGTMKKIRDALDFTKRHSPSVIDILNKGVDLANRAYSRLDLPIEPIAHQLSPVGVAAAGSGGAVINIDLSGAIISDEAGAERISEIVGDSIVRKLQASVRI